MSYFCFHMFLFVFFFFVFPYFSLTRIHVCKVYMYEDGLYLIKSINILFCSVNGIIVQRSIRLAEIYSIVH